MRILHLIEEISAGGPARCLLGYVRLSRELDSDVEHRVVSLSAGGYPPVLYQYAAGRIRLERAPEPARLAEAVIWADVVLVHYWTTPRMLACLGQGWPDCRILLWAKVNGRYPPQLLTDEIFAFADDSVLSAALPDRVGSTVVPAVCDIAPYASLAPVAHQGFNLTYAGTLNRGKMHPDFVDMMGALRTPGVKVLLAGGGLEPWIEDRIARSPAPERFVRLGFVQDLRRIYEITDVFAYPLAPDSYAAVDRTVQEAMAAALPVVVLPHGGVGPAVEDGATGRVVGEPRDFAPAIDALLADPAERQRLGRGARAFALTAFDPRAAARRLHGRVRAMLAQPKRGRAPLYDSPPGQYAGSHAFARSLGPAGAGLARAIGRSEEPAILEAVTALRGLSDLALTAEGGLIHFLKAHRDDPMLRLWARTAFQFRGDGPRADGELQALRRLAIPERFLDGYFAMAQSLGLGSREAQMC